MAGFLLSMGSLPPPELESSLPLGLPPGHTAAQQRYAEAIFHAVSTACGPLPRPGTGDPEDFWEQAARIEAALSTLLEVWLLTGSGARRLDQEGSCTEEEALARLALSLGHPDRLVAYGPIPQYHTMWRLESTSAPDRYAAWPIFNEWAGRPVMLGGVGMDSPDSNVADVLATWVRQGLVEEGEEVLLKASEAKHGLWALPASASSEANHDALLHAMGWAYVRLESGANSVLLQKKIPMTHEYRMFMVDGKPVTGAGCLEETTPLWSTGEQYSNLTRESRAWTFTREGDEEDWDRPDSAAPPPPSPNPELIKRYVEAAGLIGRGLPQEARTCVIDLAWDPEGERVVMVEANSMGNSGLYASRPRLVTEAMVRHCL